MLRIPAICRHHLMKLFVKTVFSSSMFSCEHSVTFAELSPTPNSISLKLIQASYFVTTDFVLILKWNMRIWKEVGITLITYWDRFRHTKFSIPPRCALDTVFIVFTSLIETVNWSAKTRAWQCVVAGHHTITTVLEIEALFPSRIIMNHHGNKLIMTSLKCLILTFHEWSGNKSESCQTKFHISMIVTDFQSESLVLIGHSRRTFRQQEESSIH